jgi:hypothetical protein
MFCRARNEAIPGVLIGPNVSKAIRWNKCVEQSIAYFAHFVSAACLAAPPSVTDVIGRHVHCSPLKHPRAVNGYI